MTKIGKNNTGFELFGGTSLAAPLVAGSAAILMESLNDKNIPFNPFTIKNILMSTATDLNNDPFSQGSGLVNVTSAVNFVLGKDDVFGVTNDASYSNTKKILDFALKGMNSSYVGLKKIQFTNNSLQETPWFGGRMNPGDRTSSTFTIVNPTNHTLNIDIYPEKLDLIKIDTFNGTSVPRMQDPIIQKSGVYRPDYVPLAGIKSHHGLASFFENTKPIPDDTALMVLDLTFPFSQFMNSSAKQYADNMKISSLYLYDWNKENATSTPVSKDLSLINRGGVWGTVQELRVSEPEARFQHTPLVGIYPVPTTFSYWKGDTKQNSTSSSFTVTASYYKKTNWNDVWLNSNNIQIKPYGTAKIIATIVVPGDENPGLYQGFIVFKGKSHAVNVPVSYAVVKKLQPKDLPTVIEGSNGDTLFGNGYIGGGFDMSNRYNAGDWREYYFDVTDKTTNSVAMNISWKDPDTNLSVFVVDPQGKIVQTNAPPGVLGQFQGWPSGDWLGPSPGFSEGGGFYPVKNKDATSTILYAPINQTGIYSVLIHAPLFGGRALTEPITFTSKFSTILPEESAPQLNIDIPLFINSNYTIIPKIIGGTIQDEKYYLDNLEPQTINQTKISEDLKNLSEGEHTMKFVVSDAVGHIVSKEFKFVIDNTPPTIIIKSPNNGSVVAGTVDINLDVSDLNPAQKNWLVIKTPKETVYDNKTVQLDTTTIPNGLYNIELLANDRAGNIATEKIVINVDNSGGIFAQKSPDQSFTTLVEILIGIAIASTISIFTFKKFRISKRS